MKRVDFENGTVTGNILSSALPMLLAQLLSLLYNIVDRIYIARIPEIGTAALGAVGLCFPLIVIITAFSNLLGTGGAPIFSINRGRGDEKRANQIMNTAFSMLCVGSIVLMIIGMLFARPLLVLFGASDNALLYALPYLRIYLLGTLPSMIATGMNPYINAQGYPTIGMLSVTVGAVANIILDPIFMFVFGMGVNGAAIATVISQIMSALFILYFLQKKSELKVRFLKSTEVSECARHAKDIIALGLCGFIMQVTNSLVTICCNSVLSDVGGDVYVSVMTIVSSVRQIIETPILALTDGSSPIISYNYGARRPKRVFQAERTMIALVLIYTALAWGTILLAPHFLIGIFTSDQTLITDAIPALKLYFAAFVFMDCQYIGQTTFRSLNKKKHAIFFSIFRKVVIVVPLTYLFPYYFCMGANGVFLAEPISNVIGGGLCFITMLITVIPELRRMQKS